MEALQHYLQTHHPLVASHVSPSGLIALVALLFLSTLVFFPSKTARALRNVPGPPGYPLLGSMVEFFGKGYHIAHMEWIKAYGKVCKYKVGDTSLLVADPDTVQQVGIRMFKTFHDRLMPGFLDEGVSGRGLVFGKGQYWTGVRNAVLPLFHTAKLQNFGATMHACAGQLVARLEKAAASRDDVNLLTWANEMTMDVLGSAAFGVTFNSQAEEKPAGVNLVKATSENLQGMAKIGVSTVIAVLAPAVKKPVMWVMSKIPGTLDYEASRRMAYLLKESQAIIEARRAEADVTGSRHDFLSMLTQARDKSTGEPLTDGSIRALVFEFLGAGTDTTANTIAFAVYCISNNPGVEAKLVREIRDFYAGLEKESAAAAAESRPTYDELAQFPYVEQIIQETLRLFPTGAVLTRRATEDCHVAGIHVPEGTNVLIPVYAMHHDPEVFPDPEAFRPERFDPAEAAKRHPYAYIPFGLGPRMCIGHRFAMEEAKLTLIRLYKRLTFTVVKEKVLRPDGELDLQVGIVLKPKNGMWVVPRVRA